MDGNAKEIQIISHNPECIQNKRIIGAHGNQKNEKEKKKAAVKLKLFYGTYT